MGVQMIVTRHWKLEEVPLDLSKCQYRPMKRSITHVAIRWIKNHVTWG